MYIRIYPKHNGENFYIHVGVTQGEYDRMLEWPFKLKHFITVLDFSKDNPEDLNSRIWDPTELCSGLAHLHHPFIQQILFFLYIFKKKKLKKSPKYSNEAASQYKLLGLA